MRIEGAMRIVGTFLSALLVAAGAATLSGGDSAGEGRQPGEVVLTGDPLRGQAYVEDACASCHAVEAGALASPAGEAPSFQVIADTPGMTSRALTVWLTTFHPERTMPALVVEPEDREDVIAYILSLSQR